MTSTQICSCNLCSKNLVVDTLFWNLAKSPDQEGVFDTELIYWRTEACFRG